MVIPILAPHQLQTPRSSDSCTMDRHGTTETSSVRAWIVQVPGPEAKQRKKLLRSTVPHDRETAKKLDRQIKREFRRNVRRLKHQFADEVCSSPPNTQLEIFKKALALNGLSDVSPVKVDPYFVHNLYAKFTARPRTDPNSPDISVHRT